MKVYANNVQMKNGKDFEQTEQQSKPKEWNEINCEQFWMTQDESMAKIMQMQTTLPLKIVTPCLRNSDISVIFSFSSFSSANEAT